MMSTGSATTTRWCSGARSTSGMVRSAAAFATSRGTELQARPTWLFSSGPVGDPLRPGESDAVNVKAIVAATGAREHRLFAGKLDKRELNFRERAVMRVVGGHDGDYRDWDEIGPGPRPSPRA